MNRETVLSMTGKELENFLNDQISTLYVDSSAFPEQIRGKMIDAVISLFDDTVNIAVPKYTNTDLIIRIERVSITFKVSTKSTGATVEVSRLRKKDLLTRGKFRFSDISISFYNPQFDEDVDRQYGVKVSEQYCTGGASIMLKNKSWKIIDLLDRDILTQAIQTQNSGWKYLRDSVLLNAAQPLLKKEFFKATNLQMSMQNILNKTDAANKELIDAEIDKVLNVLNL